MRHYERPFSQRIAARYEQAELAFEAWSASQGIKWHRLGMERPGFMYVPQIPAIIRAAPDYLAEATEKPLKAVKTRHFFVECKGCGEDQILKVKIDQLNEVERWQDWAGRPVLFFFYDLKHKRISPTNTLAELRTKAEDAETARFPDNNREYWKLPTDWFEWWDEVKPSDS